MVGEILRGMRFEIAFGWNLSIPKREKEVATLVEGQLAAKVSSSLRDRFEQLLDIREPVILESPADERCGGLLAIRQRL